MRPIKLKMSAFGAYVEPVCLDFEGNLRDERIFLINGATGAGKTTILDAICYALYGKASGNDRDGLMMLSKGISENISLKVEFTFSLGEKIYKVYRELSYHPNRKDKTQIKAELISNGEVIASKRIAVTKEIEELLGFNAEQFRQIVLLPQGEFKTFLTAKADERQPVLDALFNAEFYKKVEEGLKIKADAAQKIFDDTNLKKETLETQGASSDYKILEKLRADLEIAQKKSAELKQISEKAQDELTSGKILNKDFAELADRKKTLEKAQNDSAKAEKIFTNAKNEYDKRDGERSQREVLKSDLDKLSEIKKLLDELKLKQNTLEESEKALQNSNDTLKKFENDAKRFDNRLTQLKNRRSELTGAEKKLSEAKIILEKVIEREKFLQEIISLEKDLKRAMKIFSDSEKKFNGAQLEVNRLRELQIKGSAARLAKNLKDGEECPVCGSKNHPILAFSEEIIPSDEEIASAQEKADKFNKNLGNARQNVASIEGQLTIQRKNLENYNGMPIKDVAQKNFDFARKDAEEFADCEKRIATGEKYIAENKIKLDAARQKKESASNDKNKKLGELQALQSKISQEYLSKPSKIDFDIAEKKKVLSELENAWKNADKSFRDAVSTKSLCDGTLKSANKAYSELAEKIRGKTPPNINFLTKNADTARKNHLDAIKTETSLKNELDNQQKLFKQLAELEKKLSEAEKNLNLWKKLSDAASGKTRGNKLSFTRYYLRAMFDQVLTEANYRLEKMSDRRYWFKQKDEGKSINSTAGLNLEIFDEYTGESRPVATLSGGESFLASLSLALGLAAVVRNNLGGIKLDTIFIDEGFGSLDSEALDFAISTINELSGGRLVGIISHVEELKNQIPVRLEVYKTKAGSTAKFVR